MPELQLLNLNFATKRRLVIALLACDTIKDRGKRETVVKQLSAHNISRDAAETTDVFNIVSACLDYDGGLAELLDVVRLFEGNSIPMQALDQLLASLAPPAPPLYAGILSLPLLEALLALVGALPANDEVRGMYRESAPELAQPSLIADTPASMVRALVDLPRQKAAGLFPYPILAFVERLALGNQNVSQTALCAWAEKAAAQLGVSVELAELRARLRQPPVVAATPASAPPCLMVLIQPDERQAGHFAVQAWLWRAPAIVDDLDTGLQRLFTKEEARACLDDLVAQAIESGVDEARLEIEIFLPRELLCWDVDQWPISYTLTKLGPVGPRHSVMLRSLERASAGNHSRKLRVWQERWRKKWERFRDTKPAPAADLTVLMSHLNDLKDLQLLAQLQDRFGLALAYAQASSGAPADDDVLNTIIGGDTSIVLWLRDEPAAIDCRQWFVDHLLKGADLATLPLLLRNLRKDAQAKGNATPLDSLALFYDNPERLPPPFDPSYQQQAMKQQGQP